MFSFERCALLRMPFIEGPPYSPNQLILMHGVFDGGTGLCCAALYSAKVAETLLLVIRCMMSSKGWLACSPSEETSFAFCQR